LSRITFQKRQKEMKRQEKQRMKAEKRAQRKVAKQAEMDGAAPQLDGALEGEAPQDSEAANQTEAG